MTRRISFDELGIHFRLKIRELMENDLIDEWTPGTHEGEPFAIVEWWGIEKYLIKKTNLTENDCVMSIAMESVGYDDWHWGFRDEYERCDYCGDIIRTSPDSYSWLPDHWWDFDNCECICGDCIRDDEDLRDRYIEFLTQNHKHANTILDEATLLDAGFKKQGEYDYGFEGGTHPDDVEESVKCNLLFSLDYKAQFGCGYSAWCRGDKVGEAL